MSDPIFLAPNKTLGVFNKLVTGPLFRLIEEDGHILALNSIWSKLYDYLVESGRNASSSLDSKTFFEDDYISKICIYEELFFISDDPYLKL